MTKLSYRADSQVRSGDALLVMSMGTSGLLTVNSLQDGCIVTLSNKGPIPANTFTLVSVGGSSSSSSSRSGAPEPLRYGKPFRIRVHPSAVSSPSAAAAAVSSETYLASVPVSLTTSLAHKRQQISLLADPNNDTLWKAVPRNLDDRLALDGEPVSAETEVLITHVATGQPLLCQRGERRGPEWPVEAAILRPAGRRQGESVNALGTNVILPTVCSKSLSTVTTRPPPPLLSRSHPSIPAALVNEFSGAATIDVPRFDISDANSWVFLLGTKK